MKINSKDNGFVPITKKITFETPDEVIRFLIAFNAPTDGLKFEDWSILDDVLVAMIGQRARNVLLEEIKKGTD